MSANTTVVPQKEYEGPNIWVERFKYFYATVIVNLLVLVAVICIGNQYCVLQIHPAGLFILLIIALIWLGYIEGLHYSVVCLEKRDMAQFTEMFPLACKNHAKVNTTEKVKKFLVGRQFFVIFVVFLIAQITSFPYIPKNFGGMPETLVTVLFQTGLPGIAIVLTYGQLLSQLYAEQYVMSFSNLLGCNFVTDVCMGAEYIGICHFSHLLFRTAAILTCGSIRRAEQTMTDDNLIDRKLQEHAEEGENSRFEYVVADPMIYEETTAFDVFRYIWSTCVTLFSVLIIMYGIGAEYYVLPTSNIGTYFVFFAALTLLFYLEGLMIAIVAIQYYDRESFREAYPRTYMLHELVTRPDNVKRFIIGRQFCTVLTNFMLAQSTVFAAWPSDGFEPTLFWICVKSGLVGVLTVLSFGQLLPELLAAQYPLRFLDMYGCYSIVYISLFFDWIGVGHCAWFVHYCYDSISGKTDADEADFQHEKPTVKRPISPELLAATGSIIGDYETSAKSSANANTSISATNTK
jgi:hypothetical protein